MPKILPKKFLWRYSKASINLRATQNYRLGYLGSLPTNAWNSYEKKNTKKRFGFLQSIAGNTIPLDKTGYFIEMNHPGIILENKEKSETLFRAINQLPEAQRVVFTLHKVDGRSYQEIGEIIEKSVSSVESLMFRAKKNLQQLLEEFYKNKN